MIGTLFVHLGISFDYRWGGPFTIIAVGDDILRQDCTKLQNLSLEVSEMNRFWHTYSLTSKNEIQGKFDRQTE